MIERRTTERVALWERLVLMIAAPLIAGAIFGVYSAIKGVEKELYSFREAQVVIQSQINDVRGDFSGLYNTTQAKAKHEEIFRTDQDQYHRLDDHEQRLRVIEQFFYGNVSHQRKDGEK